MVGIPGISKRFFETLSQQFINIILITQASSEHSICLGVQISDSEKARKTVNTAFEYEIQLTISQQQQNQVFWMPIDVSVTHENGVAEFVVWDSLETQTFKLTVPSLPVGVELDKENWILKKVTDLNTGEANIRKEENLVVAPNPLFDKTLFSYELKESGQTELSIYNELGQLIITLLNEEQEPGSYNIEWNAHDNEPGLYFFRFSTGGQYRIGKLVLTR